MKLLSKYYNTLIKVCGNIQNSSVISAGSLDKFQWNILHILYELEQYWILMNKINIANIIQCEMLFRLNITFCISIFYIIRLNLFQRNNNKIIFEMLGTCLHTEW